MNSPLPVQYRNNKFFLIGFSIILLLVILAASTTLYHLSQINKQVNQIVNINSRKTETLQMDKLFAIQRATAKKALDNTRQSYQFVTHLTFVFGVATVLLGIFIAAAVIKRNNQQLYMIQQYHDHLEEQVDQRTNELQTINKELQSYNHSLAHDLRTPVRAVMSFSQILYNDLKDTLTKEQAYDFTRIINASDRMHNLIDDILNLAKITRSELKLSRIDISAIATQINQELTAAYPEHAVSVEIENGLNLRGDKTLVRILLDNLLSNAWKFTQATKSPVIRLGQNVDTDKNVFYLSDNGAGFDPAYAEKIFQPFQRLHRNDQFPGSGIGLAIVERVIERHNGKIWVESALGKGTTFYFTLG